MNYISKHNSTVSKDDHKSREQFRAHESNSNEEALNQISFIAVVSKRVQFRRLRARVTDDIDDFHAIQKVQKKTKIKWSAKDAQISI